MFLPIFSTEPSAPFHDNLLSPRTGISSSESSKCHPLLSLNHHELNPQGVSLPLLVSLNSYFLGGGEGAEIPFEDGDSKWVSRSHWLKYTLQNFQPCSCGLQVLSATHPSLNAFDKSLPTKLGCMAFLPPVSVIILHSSPAQVLLTGLCVEHLSFLKPSA